MADAVATPTVTFTSADQAAVYVYGTIAIGASPLTYPAHGIIMSLIGLTPTSTVPVEVDVWSQPAAGTSPSGYVYQYCPGTTQANGKLTFFTGAAAQSPLTELTAGNIPAAVSSDTIVFKAVFKKGI